jgi:hypothetical protein
MPRQQIAYVANPPCPICQTTMIVTDGFGEESQQKTFECLQCGHVEKPKASDQKGQK